MVARLARAAVIALAIASVTAMTARTRVDVDLWGHVRFGLDILESRTLHAADPYSFTSDRPWINHEWLSEIVIALAWRVAGTPGLILIKLACVLLTLALVASMLREMGITGHPRLVLLALTLLGILPRVAHVRPQLFSVVLFAGLVRVFVHSGQGAIRALLWTVPLLVLWANFHGGWLVGVGAVVLWCAGEAYALRAEPRKAGFALGCATAAAAATLVTPYGAGLWMFLFETVRFGREAIREWGPAWTDTATMIVWSVFAGLTLAALRGSFRAPWPRNPATLVIPVAWGIASLRVGRLDSFFAIAVVGLLARPLSSLFSGRAHEGEATTRLWRVTTAALALLTFAAVPPARRAFTCIDFLTPRWPEPQAAEHFQRHGLSGRVVTYFDWGEYAIWHLPRSLKVSMDGRRETVYSDATIGGHLELYSGSRQGFEFLQSLNADYIWLPAYLPVLTALQERGWTPVFSGTQSMVLARPDQVGRAAVGAITAGPVLSGRCFPGP